MKKTLYFLVFIFFIGVVSLSSPVFSQSPSPASPTDTPKDSEFDKAYDEYIIKMKEYQSAHEEYLLRRSQHLRFQSLKSQQDAQDATVKLLETRDDVVISYLNALKERINDAMGVSDVRKEALALRLDEEIGWYEDHKSSIPSAGTLDDLVKDSDEAKGRWDSISPLVYETLSTVSYGRIIDFSERTESLLNDSKSKLDEIKGEEREGYRFSNEKFDVLDRWVFETDARIIRSKEKMLDVENIIAQMIKQRKDLVKQHNQVVSVLGEAQLYLKEANSFMKEIIREVKTAEN